MQLTLKYDTERVYWIRHEDISGQLAESEGFDDELRERVFRKSIEYIGIINPIIVTRNVDGKFTVIDGVKRVEMAKQFNMDIPSIVMDVSGPMAFVIRLVTNFARRTIKTKEVAELAKQIPPGVLSRLGFNLEERNVLRSMAREKDKEVERLSERTDALSSVVTIKVVKKAILEDKKKAERMASIALRECAKTKKDMEKVEKEVDQIVKGRYCAVCGTNLGKEDVHWLMLCGSCKWTLLEEWKETAFDTKVKDWITGKYYEKEECIVVSKERLYEVLSEIPEECLVKSKKAQQLFMRLQNDLGR